MMCKKTRFPILALTISSCLFFSIFVDRAKAADVSYYIYDSPGRSVTTVTNASQDVINTYNYSDFGNIVSTTESKSNVYKYDGEQNESETGLIFLRNRYYDPTAGRFITKDPHPGIRRQSQSLNPYGYCNNNPINYNDPSGELASIIFGGLLSLWDIGTYWIADSFYNRRFANMWNDPIYGEKAMQGLFGMLIPTPFAKRLEAFSYFNTSTYGQYSYLSNTLKSYVDEAVGWGLGKAWDWGKSCFGGPPGGGGGSSLSSYGSLRSSLASYGGVSLSKTAELMLNINDVAGATYDDKTGQIILFGKEDLTLPEMDMDDLSVAVNSVYSSQDPGVSIGTEASPYPGWMKVITRIYADLRRLPAHGFPRLRREASAVRRAGKAGIYTDTFGYQGIRWRTDNPITRTIFMIMLMLIMLGEYNRRREWVRCEK